MRDSASEGDAAGDTAGDSEPTETSREETTSADDAAPAPILDAAGWRDQFARIPPRELWAVLQKEKAAQTTIFAGFRPAPEMLRAHPVVKTRLIDTAIKQPAFAKAVRELLQPAEPAATESGNASDATPPLSREREIAAEAIPVPAAPPAPLSAVSAQKQAAPPIDKNELTASREKINALRATVRQHSERIKELETTIARAQHERDTARAEIAAQYAAHQTALRDAQAATKRAEAEVRREKRLRERAALEVAAKAQAKSAKNVLPAASPTSAVPPESLLYQAAERLLQAGRFALVADLCRQALHIDRSSAIERGRVHALYAQAFYGSGDALSGAAQDRLAATAFLDGGAAVPAAEALSRLAAQNPKGFRPADSPLLRRVGALAQTTGQTETVQAVFGRLRLTAPPAYRTLRPALGQGAGGETLAAALLGAHATGATPAAIGPDEPVLLPPAEGTNLAAAVTPRRLVRAVNSGDSQTITATRAALAVLRQQNQPAATRLADALLDAVAALLPVAVCPLMHEKTRPVLVDASNVARYNADPLSLQTAPRVLHLRLMRDYLLRRGYFPVSLIADANLRYHVDDKPAYLELIEAHIVRETPPGTSADETLLQEARALSAPLVTNDRFSDWGEAARHIERIGFLVSPSGVSLTSF